MDIEKLKKRCGYDGKPQQWQYGFDLACRELAKAQAIPDGFVVVPKDPLLRMVESALKLYPERNFTEAQEQAK